MAKVVGANAVRQRHIAQCLLVQPGQLRGCLACRRQTLVKTARQRAGLAVAGLVRVFTGLFLGHKFDHAQGKCGASRSALPDSMQRIQRDLAPGRLGGQKENLVGASHRHRAQRGEQRTDGLAYARGRLHQQRARLNARPVDGACQVALPGAERLLRKLQLLQRGVPPVAVGHLLPRPDQETFTQGLKKLLQLTGRGFLADGVLRLVHQIQVHQAQREAVHTAALAHQPAVHLELRPMQALVVRRNRLQRATKRLDLFQGIAPGIETIGPPPHAQALVAARQMHLGLVVRPAPLRHQQMALPALLRRGRRRKAQVQVTRLGSERAQVAHRDGVGGVVLRVGRHGGHGNMLPLRAGWSPSAG